MTIYIEEETRAGRVHKGSLPLLKETFIFGEFERGQATEITGYKGTVLSQLVSAGLLVSDTPHSPVRLSFPIEVVERWFPKLYPEV